MKYVLLVCMIPLLVGCATSTTMLNGPYPPKFANEQIEFYSTQKPDRSYIEIAEIKSDSIWGDNTNMENLKEMARKLGADVVIITGAAAQVTTGSVNQYGLGYAATQNSGIKAIAIKYK